MNLCGHGLRDHLRFLAPLLGFITAVWLFRMALDMAGVPPSLTRVFSVTGAASLAVLLATVLIHTRGFGSYPNVVMSALILVSWGQLLIVAAIIFSVLTGIDNIFTAPEYSIPERDPNHIRHILGHLTFGLGAGSLVGAATGCLLLWILKMLVPVRPADGKLR